MIDFVRSYHKNKVKFELWVLGTNKFDEITRINNVINASNDYPIRASVKGLTVEIDEYKAYINCWIKVFHNSLLTRAWLSTYNNIYYSQLCLSIDRTFPFMLNESETKVSQIQIGFSIPTNKVGCDIINKNILMFNYKYYNHNLIKSKKRVVKKFVYTNFHFTIYADKHNLSISNFIKIELKLIKSVEFRSKSGLLNINQLRNKELLELLFSLLLKRFKELTIVDSIENYNLFEDNDKKLMQEFMTHDYWNTLSEKYSRQTVSIKKKMFENLLDKYNLLSLSVEFENELKKQFNQFINN